MALLSLAFGFELGGGIELIGTPASTGGAQVVCNVLVVLLLIGIARAWELVGNRDTGIIASIAVLAGHQRQDEEAAGGAASPAEADPSTG